MAAAASIPSVRAKFLSERAAVDFAGSQADPILLEMEPVLDGEIPRGQAVLVGAEVVDLEDGEDERRLDPGQVIGKRDGAIERI